MKIAVFCGSSTGNSPVYGLAAQTLGSWLGNNNHTLVYGGGNIGLMGLVADNCLQAKGTVIGVITDFLMEWEVGHKWLTELVVVKTMHERKQKMADLSDLFIALPGGWGTLDELAEILTWNQLHLIDKPVAVLNVNGFFTPLKAAMEKMVAEGFLKEVNLARIFWANTEQELFATIDNLQ